MECDLSSDEQQVSHYLWFNSYDHRLSTLQALDQFLKTVNEIRSQHNTRQMSAKTALKFLMARKFDVHRSLALYEAHEITRFREGLAKLDATSEPLKSELETGKFTVLVCLDWS